MQGINLLYIQKLDNTQLKSVWKSLGCINESCIVNTPQTMKTQILDLVIQEIAEEMISRGLEQVN